LTRSRESDRQRLKALRGSFVKIQEDGLEEEPREWLNSLMLQFVLYAVELIVVTANRRS